MFGTAGFDVADFVENFEVIVGSVGGVEQLRGLILNLAIRGRLGTQDVEDTPAHALVHRVAHELGKGRRPRVLAVAPSATYDLPTGWVWCEPQELGVVSPRNDVDDDVVAGFVPMTTVPTDYRRAVVPDARPWREIKKGYTHVADGDIAVAKITPCFQNGKSCVMRGLPNGVGAGTTELLVLRPVAGAVEPNYLLLFFKSPDFVAGGVALMTGTAGQQRVPTDYFAAVRVPLPPLAEQKRIVAKVDQLMALCDELEARQTKKRDISTRLTKSALEALTTAEDQDEFDAAWKRVVENFDVVIGHSRQVEDLRRQVLALGIAGRLHGAKPQPAATTVGDFVRFQNGYAFKSEWFKPHGTRLLRNANVGHGEVGWGDLACVDEGHAHEFSRFALADGDIVVSLDRPIISTGVKVARVRPVDLPCLLLQRVGRVQIKDRTQLTANYFFHWLRSRWFVDAIDPGRSSGVPHISTKDIEALPFSPPTVAEQDRIVRLMERLLPACDELEQKLRRSETVATRLVAAAVAEIVA